MYLQLVSKVRLDVRGELAREERVGKGGKRRLAEVCGRPVECVLGTTNICRVRRTPQVPVGRALDDAHAYVEVRPGHEPVVRLDGPRQAKSGLYTGTAALPQSLFVVVLAGWLRTRAQRAALSQRKHCSSSVGHTSGCEQGRF